MSNVAKKNDTNTISAEAALLSGDQSNAVRFDKAAEVYAKKADKLGKSKTAADKALFLTVQAGIVLAANDPSIKRADFMPLETTKGKDGKPVVKQKQGRFGGAVGNVNQANCISKAVCNKKVQDAISDATPAGQDTNIAIVESVCIANKWTSYKKLTKATAVKRDKYPLNSAGEKRMGEIEAAEREINPAGIENSNSAGLRQYLHSIEAYRK